MDLFTARGVPDYFTDLARQVNEAQDALLRRVKAVGLVREDIGPVEFQLGLATITRPLTDDPAAVCAAPDAWLVDLYLRGLRPGPTPETDPKPRSAGRKD